jgi:hypothetical protein
MLKVPYRFSLAKELLACVLAFALAALPLYGDEQAPATPPAPSQPAPQTAPAPASPLSQPVAAPAQPAAALPIIKDLRIIVLAGNGETNDLEHRVMAPLVVQVLDQNDRPVQGAEVVFRFPVSGPGATFSDGKPTGTIRTNGTGEAAAMHWTANGQTGTFEVHVNAAYGNEIGETTVKMTNAASVAPGSNITMAKTAGAKKSHWYSPTWVKIALIAGVAGAGVGIWLGLRGGSHAANTAPITVTPGTPSVGGPH